jgi:hypothetical protein
MRCRRCADAAVVVLAVAVLGGCGGSGESGAAATTQPAGEAIAITAPADGRAIKARETRGGALRARVRVRGRAPAGGAVALNASCRPRVCTARATARADGRWSVALTLTTTRAARFVTIDAGSGRRGAAPTAVTTIELDGPRRAPVRAPSTRRSASATPPPRSLPHDVLVIGDSLAVGMDASLRAALPGWRVHTDARSGRPLAEGMAILAAQPAAPAIVAFSLFTNDTPGATAALEQAVRSTATRAGGCAVWATVVRPPQAGVSYAPANALLRRLAGEPDLALGLQLVDWSAAVARSPASYLAGDGVHGTPAGYRARGQLYAEAIRACAGES